MKKILIIHKNIIENEPPTQMVIQHLADLGYGVRVITLGLNDYWKEDFGKKGIEYKDLGLREFVTSKKRSFFAKIKTWLQYRKEVLKELSGLNDGNSVVWFVDADSIAPLLFSKVFNKIDYILHILELYDHSSFYRFVLNKYIKTTKRLIVCEENRAAIFNVWFKPEKYPAVLANKPYKLLDTAQSGNFLNENYPELYNILVKDSSKVILYQGVISPDRDLSFILKAINEMPEDFIPVLMGRDYNMLARYKEICPRLIHISFIPAPQHLYITALARIGILMYDPISLNQIFCAPNKIFEYSGYGIPMIGNNIPGLSFPFQKFGCGKIFSPAKDTAEMKKIIEEIDNNFEKYSHGAKVLFNSVDNKKMIREILECL